MKNKRNYILYKLLVVILMLNNLTYADVKTSIKPYLWDGKPVIDTQFKVIYNKHVKGVVTFIPIEVRPGISKWDIMPEYYVLAQNDSLGRLTIGGHNADILMVDAGTFAVGNGDIFNDGNHLYSQSLINTLQTQGYKYKISYLIKQENVYLSSAYSPLDNITQMRFLYTNSLSVSTDFKTSISIVNNKIFSGFNLKYLGFIFGGSYGGDFYTAGLGYSIGPFKSSLTYLSDGKNLSCGLQYNVNKNISPFMQIGHSHHHRTNISLGLKFTV
jgi:hypothetical protein